MGSKKMKKADERSPPATAAGTGKDDERHAIPIPSNFFPDSAMVRSVTEIEATPYRKDAKLWLPQSAMISASILPGSLVSVSLCGGPCPLNSGGEAAAAEAEPEPENYAAIALAFPCNKVVSHGVRLSWCLASTLGFPGVGANIVLNPITSSDDVIACQQLKLDFVRQSSPKATIFRSNNAKSSDEPSTNLFISSKMSLDLLHHFASRWLDGRYLLSGNLVTIPVCGQVCIFRVKQDANKDTPLLIGRHTRIDFNDPPAAPPFDRPASRENTIFCGLSQHAELKKIMMLSLISGSAMPRYRYKGVLLHGPPGTGKTSLVYNCTSEVGARLLTINGTDDICRGEGEQALHDIFQSARKFAPAVVFIDELDSIAPARTDRGEESSIHLVAALLKFIDEIDETERLLVVAATNRPDCIDRALRRPGRLDREIEMGVPTPDDRSVILNNILAEMGHSLDNQQVQYLALATHGFVGADLVALCYEAAKNGVRRYIKSPSSYTLLPKSPRTGRSDSSEVDSFQCSPLESNNEVKVFRVNLHDFEYAMIKVGPSAMRQVRLELPKVSWDDVGGQSKAKKQLIEAVIWPQLYPDVFKRIGSHPPRGILMFGPPGCSKTLMARAIASEAKLNFFAVKGPELFSKWVGDSEKAVKFLFDKARANAPAIIFFDEIDGFAGTRGQDNDGTCVADRVITQLLVEMCGLDQRPGVIVIAATNRPDRLDPALLRRGRFDTKINVQPPDCADREEIFRIHLRKTPCNSDVSMKELASLTGGYTGADIKYVCGEAAVAALEESNFTVTEVSMRHFRDVIGRTHSTDVRFCEGLLAKLNCG